MSCHCGNENCPAKHEAMVVRTVTRSTIEVCARIAQQHASYAGTSAVARETARAIEAEIRSLLG